MALGSNAPRCAAGDCREQLRFDVHQLHRVGLLMVSDGLDREPTAMGERCGAENSTAAHSYAQRGDAEMRLGLGLLFGSCTCKRSWAGFWS